MRWKKVTRSELVLTTAVKLLIKFQLLFSLSEITDRKSELLTSSLTAMAQSRNDVARELASKGLLLNPLNLINIELVSFEQALEPIKHLVVDLDDFIFVSSAWAESETPPGVSRDVAAALNLYTREWMNKEDSLYFVLNSAFRTEDRQIIKPFLPFLRLLFEGFNTLPK